MSIPPGFPQRHIGPSQESCAEMLRELGCDTLEALIDEAVPESIRLEKSPTLPDPLSETAALEELREIMRSEERRVGREWRSRWSPYN